MNGGTENKFKFGSTGGGKFSFGGDLSSLAKPLAKPSEATKYHFGTGVIFSTNAPNTTPFEPQQFGLGSSSSSSFKKNNQEQVTNNQDEEGDDSAIEGPNKFVEGTTGEENDEVLVDCNAILHEMVMTEDKDTKKTTQTWSERGKGHFHFNKSGDAYRFTMRRQEIKSVCLNTRLFKGMRFEKVSTRNIRFTSVGEENKITTYLLTINPKDMDTLMTKVQEVLDKL